MKSLEDVCRRHDNCTCDVSYVSEKGRQNVHTKHWMNEQAKAKRIEYAASVPESMNLTKAEVMAKESKILVKRRSANDRKYGMEGGNNKKLPENMRFRELYILLDRIAGVIRICMELSDIRNS